MEEKRPQDSSQDSKPDSTPSNERRRALKKIVVGGSVVSSSVMLPKAWVKPVIDQIIVPAHAQTSPSPTTTAPPGQTTPAPTTTAPPGQTTPAPTTTEVPFGCGDVYICDANFKPASCSSAGTICCGESLNLGDITRQAVKVILSGFAPGATIGYGGKQPVGAYNPSTISGSGGAEIRYQNGNQPYTVTITVGGSCVMTIIWEAGTPGGG